MQVGPMAGDAHYRLDLRRALIAAAIVGALIFGGVGGLLAYSAAAIDRAQVGTERTLASIRLKRTTAKLLEDVQSATIWNDSVTALQRGDLDWMQVNFGDYYADYMDHDVTLVFDSSGRMIRASRNSEPVPEAAEAVLVAAVRPTVDALQAQRPGVFGFAAAQHASRLVKIGDDVYLLAAATIVPEDASVTRARRDPVVVSGRKVTAVVDSLGADLGLAQPRFSQAKPHGDAFVPVGEGRQVLGYLTWTPARPGAGLLKQAAPYLVFLVLLLAAAAAVLWRKLDGSARTLEHNQVELALARDKAQAASQAKTRFLTNMSHELRTPLNGVLGMAEVMSHGDLSDGQRANLNILKASGEDLLRMIEHILQVTRLERSEVRLAVAPFDVTEMLSGLISQARAVSLDRPIRLILDSDIEGVWIGDGEHLRQALAYLMTNATTFTRAGQISLTARAEDDAVRFTVSDTGVGMPPEFLERLFEDFAQADDSLTRAHEGAGLGLSICRRLVVAMGGRIEVDSRLGVGSTFAVIVPLTPVRHARAAVSVDG